MGRIALAPFVVLAGVIAALGIVAPESVPRAADVIILLAVVALAVPTVALAIIGTRWYLSRPLPEPEPAPEPVQPEPIQPAPARLPELDSERELSGQTFILTRAEYRRLLAGHDVREVSR